MNQGSETDSAPDTSCTTGTWQEPDRLAALERYDILDTPREPEFDDIVRLVADVFDASIAVVNLLASTRQWFKAEVGIGADELPLDVSICAHAILQPGVFVVPDTTKDPRFASNPLVAGEPGLRFYAGALLETPEGLPIGTVCVLDTKPRPKGITDQQRLTLEVLARQVMTQLELRRVIGLRDAEVARASASEQNLKLVLDSARDYAIVTTDPERRITSFSAGAEKAFALSADEAIGRMADELFTPEDRANGRPEHEVEVAAKEGCSNDERWHQRADGTRVFLNGSVHPLLGEADGSARGFIKIARDETERRAAEAVIAESEGRFRNLADHAPVMMWVTDPSGACTYLNRGWYEFTGQTPEDAEGFGWLEATHPDDKEDAERVFLEANTARAPFRLEYRLRHAGGTYRWAIDAAAPRFGQDGEFLGYVGSVIDINERREAEAALRETEERLRLAVDNAEIGFWDVDIVHDTLIWPPRTKAMFGISADEPVTLADFYSGLHPDDASATADAFAAAADPEKRALYDVEYRTIGKEDGVVRWVAAKGRGVFAGVGASAKCVRVAGTAIDVSARKAAEAALQASEERYRTLFGSIESGFCVAEIDAEACGGRGDYRIIEANPAFYRQTGFPEDILGQWLRKAVPALEEHWYEIYGRVARTGEPERFEDGSEALGRWFDVYAFRIGEPDEQRVAILFNDISARRNAETRLRDLNETLERRVEDAIADRDRTWNNARDLLLVVGIDGVFRATNPAWEDVLGWREDELTGRNYLDLIHPDDHPSSKGALATATQAELPTYENRYRRKDGSYRWLSWVAAPEGDLIYASGRDITAEKEQADALLQAEEQLRQAQKMEAVGQLTGGIAHDFNNLLTGVIGSLDMMQRRLAKGETDKIERYATTAMTAANRAAALTHRLLAFARRQPLDPKPVNANRLVSGMEELLRRTIGESVRLEMVTAGGLWQTLCDPHQLESAVLNLAINARDAMPDGGTLTLETSNAHLDSAYTARSRGVRPGQYVCVSVTDTGSGMAADVIAKAFEPFFTTKPIGQGTGLGLSMIYGFAQQSEGYAKIYSEVGQGTTFKLYLPRFYGEGDDAEEATTVLGDEHLAAPGEVVLVVEDETAVRDLVVEVLEELGYKAIEAVDGPSGLKLVQSGMRIDLLVTDIGLPGLNGRQLADAARQKRSDLKVLFMTGYAENATIANGFLDPGMEMITKPFAIEALATRIRGMIET